MQDTIVSEPALRRDRRRALMEAISLEVRRSQNRTDAYDEAVSEAVGINRTDHRCLDVLDQEGGATAGRLAEVMGLSTGAITAVIDRLERAGFARRVRDEQDRRRVRVEMTDEARETMLPYYQPLHELSQRLYARYTDEQLELLLDFLRTADVLYDGMIDELRGSPAEP
jgi:DNA-binding MarR family transcriptional regulator